MQHNCCQVCISFSSLHDVIYSRDPGVLVACQLPRRMRMKGQALGGVEEGGWTSRVTEEREWDQLLLRDVRSDRAIHGKPISCSLFIRKITHSGDNKQSRHT